MAVPKPRRSLEPPLIYFAWLVVIDRVDVSLFVRCLQHLQLPAGYDSAGLVDRGRAQRLRSSCCGRALCFRRRSGARQSRRVRRDLARPPVSCRSVVCVRWPASRNRSPKCQRHGLRVVGSTRCVASDRCRRRDLDGHCFELAHVSNESHRRTRPASHHPIASSHARNSGSDTPMISYGCEMRSEGARCSRFVRTIRIRECGRAVCTFARARHLAPFIRSPSADVPPTIIYKKASNWVDRGEPALPTLRRVLAHFFERLDPLDEPWLEEHATIVLGMVAADATEIHIAGYLRSVVRDTGSPTRQPLGARPAAIALWHIAKAALVRDFAERVLRGDVPVNEPTPDSFSHWMASRLLTPGGACAIRVGRSRRRVGVVSGFQQLKRRLAPIPIKVSRTALRGLESNCTRSDSGTNRASRART